MRTEESSLREPSAVDIVWWLAVYSVAPDLNPARIDGHGVSVVHTEQRSRVFRSGEETG
mgnify:CR=1 FL=1